MIKAFVLCHRCHRCHMYLCTYEGSNGVRAGRALCSANSVTGLRGVIGVTPRRARPLTSPHVGSRPFSKLRRPGQPLPLRTLATAAIAVESVSAGDIRSASKGEA